MRPCKGVCVQVGRKGVWALHRKGQVRGFLQGCEWAARVWSGPLQGCGWASRVGLKGVGGPVQGCWEGLSDVRSNQSD